jgi:hypothetical protein
LDGGKQPKTVKWNPKGYLFKAWHHVEVNAV